MIKYHGTPITPKEIFFKYMKNKNTLISYADYRDIDRATNICKKVIIDNGAFSVWKQGKTIDWDDYYAFVRKHHNNIELFFIPDVIDGTEEENNKMIDHYERNYKESIPKGVPIWHVAESIERLKELMSGYDYIGIGSSGEYSVLGTRQWHIKMDKAMSVLCDSNGLPKVRIHMLRCLDKKIFKYYPFYSGDSTTFAQNHKKYFKGKGNKNYSREKGILHLLSNLERYNSPERYTKKELN